MAGIHSLLANVYRSAVAVLSGKGYVGPGMIANGYASARIDALTYVTETSALLGSNFGANLHMAASVQSSTTGYTTGFFIAPNNNVSDLRISTTNFATDALGVLGINLTADRPRAFGMVASTAGYIAGGIPYYTTPGYTKITYATNTLSESATIVWNLEERSQASNSSLAGYMRGYGSDTFKSAKFTFSTETKTLLGFGFAGQQDGVSAYNSATIGYFAGGITGASPSTQQNVLQGVDFSTDTQRTLSALMSLAKGLMGGHNSTQKGYISGGLQTTTAAMYSTIEAMSFTTETFSTLSANIGVARYNFMDNYQSGGMP